MSTPRSTHPLTYLPTPALSPPHPPMYRTIMCRRAGEHLPLSVHEANAVYVHVVLEPCGAAHQVQVSSYQNGALRTRIVAVIFQSESRCKIKKNAYFNFRTIKTLFNNKFKFLIYEGARNVLWNTLGCFSHFKSVHRQMGPGQLNPQTIGHTIIEPKKNWDSRQNKG